MEPSPFVVREGRLVLDDVDLTDLVGALEGQAAWVVSQTALDQVMHALPYPSTIAVGALGPVAILERLAQQEWWARCHSVHELQLALGAGFPVERIVASGAVQDDGFVMQALTRGVAVLELADEAQRQNVERIAGFLGASAPAEDGAPDEADALGSGCFGGLLAPVLTAPPAVAVDAPWPPRGPGAAALADRALHLWPLRPGVEMDVTLSGLAGPSGAALDPASLHGPVARGDWVVVPTPWATGLRWSDRVYPEAPTVLVRGSFWRMLEARPDPPAGG